DCPSVDHRRQHSPRFTRRHRWLLLAPGPPPGRPPARAEREEPERPSATGTFRV
ncbi:MAG: hypothetical protein AVDCRST_MAG66-3706, partial [uncultured Pseudonocardia sp.]